MVQTDAQAPMPEFSRLVPLGRIGTLPYEMTVTAKPDECKAIAVRLGVPSVPELKCAYRVIPAHRRGHFTAHGMIEARVRRICVVTLEHFTETIADRFEVRFVPESQFKEDDGTDPDAIDEVPYPGDALDLGEEAVAQLALMLDPYPRKDNARHDTGVDVVPVDGAPDESGDEDAAAAEDRPSPFAGLAKLRDKMQ